MVRLQFSERCTRPDNLLRVSCVRFSPNVSNPVIVSCGWDRVVKVSHAFFLSDQVIPVRYDALSSIFATSEDLVQ